MKFGLFYELSVPRPWTRESERTVYNNALEQVKLADELGFDQVWAVEHHFLEEYSHCPAPELFLTACAMLTKDIRVGHGIIVCVPEFNHPIKIAEKTAVLDILSGGRLEVGTGRSATWTELAGFNANPDDTKKSWDEFVRCLPKMWTSEQYAYEGEFWSMPSRTILPKVYQRPHPPMWVAVTSPGTELDAADRGLGSLGLTFGQFAEQEKKIAEYRRRIQLCNPVGDFVNDQVSSVNFLYCHEDDQVARERGKKMADTFNYLATQLTSVREVFPGRSYPSLGLLPQLRRAATGPEASEQAGEGLCLGGPERVPGVLQRDHLVRDPGIDQRLCADDRARAAGAVHHHQRVGSRCRGTNAPHQLGAGGADAARDAHGAIFLFAPRIQHHDVRALVQQPPQVARGDRRRVPLRLHQLAEGFAGRVDVPEDLAAGAAPTSQAAVEL